MYERRVLRRDRRFWGLAYEIAKRSTCRYQFGAVLARGKTIRASGCNQIKTHPLMQRYGNYCISIHAEARTLLRAQKGTQGATLYVARSHLVQKSSFPCSICLDLARKAGVVAIVFRDNTSIRKIKL
jgi:deoxycytidylate deaminase